MPLSREEIEKIAKSSAQSVLERLHRYTVAYKEPKTIEQGLQESMIEERTAADWYHKRAEHAKDNKDADTADLYRDIADEEDYHYDELKARLLAIGGITAWVYEKVGTTEVRGRRDTRGNIDIEQVSPAYDKEDFGKAVELIEKRLKELGSNPGEYEPETTKLEWPETEEEWKKVEEERIAWEEAGKLAEFTPEVQAVIDKWKGQIAKGEPLVESEARREIIRAARYKGGVGGTDRAIRAIKGSNPSYLKEEVSEYKGFRIKKVSYDKGRDWWVTNPAGKFVGVYFSETEARNAVDKELR